jgi:hypothetical protein
MWVVLQLSSLSSNRILVYKATLRPFRENLPLAGNFCKLLLFYGEFSKKLHFPPCIMYMGHPKKCIQCSRTCIQTTYIVSGLKTREVVKLLHHNDENKYFGLGANPKRIAEKISCILLRGVVVLLSRKRSPKEPLNYAATLRYKYRRLKINLKQFETF